VPFYKVEVVIEKKVFPERYPVKKTETAFTHHLILM
jgi:hypothetical protein